MLRANKNVRVFIRSYTNSCDYFMINLTEAGADPGFSFGGGGGGRNKRLCARTHITSAGPNSLSAGVQGLLKGPGSSRVVLMLSRAI